MSQKECSHYYCCTPTPLMSGIQNMQARFGGPTGRSSRLPCCSGSTLHLQLLTLSTLFGIGATDGSGCRTPPIHPSSTLLVGLRVSVQSTDPSGESLSTPNEVCSTRVDRAMFSSEIDVPAPKGMMASIGVATRNSQL